MSVGANQPKQGATKSGRLFRLIDHWENIENIGEYLKLLATSYTINTLQRNIGQKKERRNQRVGYFAVCLGSCDKDKVVDLWLWVITKHWLDGGDGVRYATNTCMVRFPVLNALTINQMVHNNWRGLLFVLFQESHPRQWKILGRRRQAKSKMSFYRPFPISLKLCFEHGKYCSTM